jgi:predicted HTH transcriptional regulator
MLPINLSDLDPSHIQGLVDSEVAESQSLEYKQKLPSGQSDEKREFLYDVAAMANANGGDLVFGIVDRRGEDKQATGIAESVSGIKLSNPQSEIDRLANLIRDGIEPRISGIVMRVVSCHDGDVLVVRVPASWNKPHMVTIRRRQQVFQTNSDRKISYECR